MGLSSSASGRPLESVVSSGGRPLTGLSQLRVPFTCLVVSEPTVQDCLKLIEKYDRMVDSFEVNLSPLGSKGLSDIFRSTSKPCIAAHRRPSYMALYGYPRLPEISEESRVDALKLAVGLGAAAADIELDTFSSPSGRGGKRRPGRGPGPGRSLPGLSLPGLSMERDVVRLQSNLAEEVRASGAEVVMSCSLPGVLRKTQARRILRAAEKRGGKFVSMMSHTPQRQDLFEVLGCVFSLQREATVPFAVTSVGPGLSTDRLLPLLAGSTWAYCRAEGRHGLAAQPSVEDAINFIESLGLREP